MKIRFMVASSMFAVPVCAVQDCNTSERCKLMDVMMAVHKAEPDKPDRSADAPLLPKPQNESTGPAVLSPNCKNEDRNGRKKGDYPLA